MTPAEAAALTPGTVVIYQGSVRSWRGPMVVAATACDCPHWPHRPGEPRLTLAGYRGGPVEVSHVNPASIRPADQAEHAYLLPDPAELAAWLETRRR